MGGRGASSGISDKGKPYGTEYKTMLKSGNIKFVESRDSGSVNAPKETMVSNRVYVTVLPKYGPVYITYYDHDNKKCKSIDLQHTHKGVKPHVHHGYEHNEWDSPKGFANLSMKERAMVDRVMKIWYNYKSRK